MSFTNPPNADNQLLVPVIAIPSSLAILAISQSDPMVITVNANSDQMNTYIPGQNVKLTVPITFGMWQSNGLTGTITAILGNQLTLNIYSSTFDPFVIPANSGMVATLAPSGSKNLSYNNSTGQVPFQSFNNVGN